MGKRTGKPARRSGWRQWKTSEARRVVEAWRASGLPLETFARRRGLTPQRLRWWKHRLGEWRTGDAGAPAVSLVPAVVTGERTAGRAMVTLRAGEVIGTLWGYVGDEDTALYLYASTGKKRGQREGELGPEDFLALREGLVVADAAGLYDESFKRATLVECGCNMHSRRYFRKALDRGDTRAALPLAAFKKLYDIEEEICGRNVEERRACGRRRVARCTTSCWRGARRTSRTSPRPRR